MVEDEYKLAQEELNNLTKNDETGLAYFSVDAVHYNMKTDPLRRPSGSKLKKTLDYLVEKGLAKRIKAILYARMSEAWLYRGVLENNSE